MKRLLAITLCLSLTACASFQTRERRAREAAEMGLVTHPELADVNERLRVVVEKLDTVLQRLEATEESHRADIEMVLERIRVSVDELKEAVKKP